MRSKNDRDETPQERAEREERNMRYRRDRNRNTGKFRKPLSDHEQALEPVRQDIADRLLHMDDAELYGVYENADPRQPRRRTVFSLSIDIDTVRALDWIAKQWGVNRGRAVDHLAEVAEAAMRKRRLRSERDQDDDMDEDEDEEDDDNG